MTEKAASRNWEAELSDMRNKAYIIAGFCKTLDILSLQGNTSEAQAGEASILSVLPRLSDELSHGLDQFLTQIPQGLLEEKS